MIFRKIGSLIRSQARYVLPFFPGSPFRRFRNWIWRLLGFDVDKSANIMPSAILICGNIKIGSCTYVGDDVMITGGDIRIGDKCDVGPRVIIHAGSHYSGTRVRRAGVTYSGQILIGNGCWICTGAIILAGANIGSGSVVAAGSVVRAGKYPDDSLLAGVPAKVVKNLI